jgi:hypothetical protein
MIESFVQFNEGKKEKQNKKGGNNSLLVSSFVARIESKQELKIIECIFKKKEKAF